MTIQRNSIQRRNMLALRRQRQLERVPGIVKRNVRWSWLDDKQRRLTMPRLKTGKKYYYVGKK